MSDDLPPPPTAPKKRWVPALTESYPPGCPDRDWCAGNKICYWQCYDDGTDSEVPDPEPRSK